jgi:outer membrane protein
LLHWHLHAALSVGLLCLPLTAAAEDLWQVYQLAEKKDPQLAAQQASYLAITERRPQAIAQAFLPTAQVDAAGSLNRQDITSAFGRGGVSTFNNYNYQLTVKQPVYHHDRFVALRQANKTIQQAEAQLGAARQDLIVRVAERYFEVLAAADNLRFAEAEKTALERQLEQSRKRFEVGLIAITDLQEAQAGHDRAVAQEIEARNQLENARESLREVIGSDPKDVVQLGQTIPLVSPEPANIEKWTETAMRQSLQITAADLAAAIADEEIKRQRAGHLPSLDIDGSYGFSSRGGQFAADTEAGTIGLALTVPVYEGGAVVSRTREAKHKHQEALDRLEQQRRATHRNTRSAYLGVVANINRVKALEQAVVSNQTAVQATQAGFEVGTRTGVDVVTAERALFQGRRDFARARYDYVLNSLRLKLAAGTLSPEDMVQVNAWLNHPVN